MSRVDQKYARPANKVLSQRGRTVDVASDTPFPIQGELAWYVSAGRVDVFVVPMEGAGSSVPESTFFVRASVRS